MKIIYLVVMTLLASPLWAGKADVVEVRVQCRVSCTFNVTLQHADTGWQHYADKWQVLAPDGTLLDERVLHHPHVNEQPFTRSLSGVSIPAEIKQVTIRGRDSKHGFGGVEKTVTLPPGR